MGNGGCHLPDDQVSRTGRKGLSNGVELHLTAAAKDVAVIVFLVGIRILPVPQGIENQKIFHIHEDTEDFSLIKISQ
jgi:hypothetical protein